MNNNPTLPPSGTQSPDPPPLCTLVIGAYHSAPPIEVLEALPSGQGLRLVIRSDGILSRVAAGALRPRLADAESGEPIPDLLQYVRLRWARRICAAHGGWPLHRLIDALLINGFGPTTAADLARALSTWERFEKAIDQLCDAAIPESREAFVLAHNARGKAVGVFEASPDALDHALDLYPEPLSSLLDACGPRAWRGLRAWGRSPERPLEVEQLLAVAPPLPFGPGDYEAFLRERFAAPPGA
jgi:hypothetical protein